MNFTLDYSTELEAFNIFMITERQRKGMMLFFRSYNTHTHTHTHIYMHRTHNVLPYHVPKLN